VVTIPVIWDYTKYMKVLLAEKKENNISAIKLVLSQIRSSEIKGMGSILTVSSVKGLYKKLLKETPEVLIMNGGFVNSKTKEMVPELQSLYPLMGILILSSDFKLEKEYLKIGVKDFILKGDSAREFYDSMVVYLTKENNRKRKKLIS
jgi:DNA-binding NarL/FixJ family response regulator